MTENKKEGPCARGEEEEEKKKNVINTVINTLEEIRLIKTFSITPDKIPVYSIFCEVARREGGSRGFSETLVKAMEEYNKRHGLGNNQLRIINYMDQQEPGPNQHVCNYSKGNTNDGQVFCGNPSIGKLHEKTMIDTIEGQWLPGVYCYGCQFNKLRKR